MLSLSRLERKQKKLFNPFRIRIFLFLSYSFGIETINTFIHSVVPLKTIPDSRPKWAKCIPVIRAKRRKNPTRWGSTYLYGLYRGVSPGSPNLPAFLPLARMQNTKHCWRIVAWSSSISAASHPYKNSRHLALNEEDKQPTSFRKKGSRL